MVYTFELIKHANIRYREPLVFLSRCELISMLRSLSVFTEVIPEAAGGSRFLTFESRGLSAEELSFLSGHSSIALMAEKRGELLRPLPVQTGGYLPEDLPEILKYKGKTSPTFTKMMLNTALALTDFRNGPEPLILFDPVCGKGTTCFCGLCAGMNAVGLDQDQKALKEASDFFQRYLKYHQMKHRMAKKSETVRKRSLPVTEFTFAADRDAYQAGDTRQLTLACSDTEDSPALFRRQAPHLIVADLPYGVQHAPHDSRKQETLARFLGRVVPVWKKVLRPGGAIAVSFNTLTLPVHQVRTALQNAGFRLPEDEMYSRLRHEVEQAVVRDVVFALNTKEE